MPDDIVQSAETRKGNKDAGIDKNFAAMESKTVHNNRTPSKENMVPKEEEKQGVDQGKRMRSQRKRKRLENYKYYCDDSDNMDLSDDSSSQEYKPSEEERDEDERVNSAKRRKSMAGGKTIMKPPRKVAEKSKPVQKRRMKAKVATLKDTSTRTNLDMPNIFNEGTSSPPVEMVRKKKGKGISAKRKIAVSDREDSEKANDTAEEEDESRVISTGKNNVLKLSNKGSKYGQPYSITGSWYIASGYLEDLLELLHQFENEESWRFSAFSSCWKGMKFSLIYRGRQSFKELLEFSEEVADITKRFLTPSQKTKMRVGALYTLYGIYYKHPMRQFFKIRLVKEEYYHLKDLIEPFRYKAENPDPAIIFRTMEIDGVFHHTATAYEMCLDFQSAEREEVGLKYELQHIATTSAVTLAMPMDVLETDDALMQHYDALKSTVLNTKTPSAKAVSMVDRSVTSEVKNAVLQLKEDLLVAVGLKNQAEPASGAQQTDGISDIGRRRSEVRNKAVSGTTAEGYLKSRGLVAKEKCGAILTTVEHNICRGKRKHKTYCESPREVEAASNECDANKISLSNIKKKAPKSSRNTVKPMLVADEKVINFMKPPSAEVTNAPLRPMRSTEEVYKARRNQYEDPLSNEEEVDDPPEMSEGDNSCWEDISSPDHKNISRKQDLVEMPKVKKQRRGRQKILCKAVEEAKEYEKKRRSTSQCGRPRGRPRKDSMTLTSNFTQTDKVVQTHVNSQITTETSGTLPLKTEEKQSNKGNGVRDDLDKNIILNVQISTNDNHNQSKKLKIMKADWKAISEDEKKLFTLKKKVLGMMYPERKITDDDMRDTYTEMTVMEMPVKEVENEDSSKSPLNMQGQNEVYGSAVKKKGVLMIPVRMGGKVRLLPMLGSKKEQEKVRESLSRTDTNIPLDPVQVCNMSLDPTSSVILPNLQKNSLQNTDPLDLQQKEVYQKTDSVMELGPPSSGLDPLSFDPPYLESLPIRKREASYQQVTPEITPIKQEIRDHDSKENATVKRERRGIAYSAMDLLMSDDGWRSDGSTDVPKDSDFQAENVYLSESQVTNSDSTLGSHDKCPSQETQKILTSTKSKKSLSWVMHPDDPRPSSPPSQVPALPIMQNLNTIEQGQMSRCPAQIPPQNIHCQPVTITMPPFVPCQQIGTSRAFVSSRETFQCVTLLAQEVPGSVFKTQYLVRPQSTEQSYSNPVSDIPIPSTSGDYTELQETPNNNLIQLSTCNNSSEEPLDTVRYFPVVGESEYMTINDTLTKISELPNIVPSATQSPYFHEKLISTKDPAENVEGGDEEKVVENIPVSNQLQTPSQVSGVTSFTSPRDVTRENYLPREPENQSWKKMPSQTTYNCQKESQKSWSSPVCSFLFSPKYKPLSKLKETVGIATGTPVQVKTRPRVPFVLKHSLVQKSKRKLV
ncbi:uncharacterized protein LOC122250431 isoform X2 [Penaeus japonicus]|uniref:uncharacterized protein LOC122250431 isoform X2 n=1 Tax=Penaeus japonicus TaxID=27405 RepID=UPI001C7163EC|nr:uncharacterized protein LOC122250431 isoform X2 [Penaeus japonicus]